MFRPFTILAAGAAAVIIGLALVAYGDPTVEAHGTVDQTLTGDPACNGTNFPHGVASSGPMLQEFVPATTDLVAVDVCLASGSLAVPFTINIHSGTAASPGGIIATGAGVTSGGSLAYVHVDLSGLLATTPATMLVIEIPVPTNEVDWYGNLPTDPDLYPPGTSNNGFVGDFAFRTYSSGQPPAGTPTTTSTPTATTTPTRTATPSNTAAAGTATPTSPPPHANTPTRTATTAPAGTTPAATATHATGQPTSPGGGTGAGGVRPPDTGHGASSDGGVSPISLVLLACGAWMIGIGAIIAARPSVR